MHFDLLGPILKYELVRAARKVSTFRWRAAYAFVLLLFLAWNYQIWQIELSFRRSLTGQEVPQRELAKLAASFFSVIAITQYVVAVLFTPAYVAGAVVRDKEQKILDFLLSSDLSSREILFGKLIGRLADLTMLLLAGLPVLAFVQFFGGVDPELVLYSTAATAVTVAGLSGVSLLISVMQHRTRTAIFLSYLTIAAYFFSSILAYSFARLIASGQFTWTNWFAWAVPIFDLYSAGNPLMFLFLMETGMMRGSNVPIGELAASFITGYATFHLAVFAAAVFLSTWLLRRVASAHSAGPAKRSRARWFPRPPVGNRPMSWKEIYIETLFNPGLIGKFIIGLFVLAIFAPAVIIVVVSEGSPVEPAFNIYAMFMSVLFGSLMLVTVAVRAAGSVGGERDRDTLVSLLTSPLTSREILAGKWLGSLFAVRGQAGLLAVVLAVCQLFGGLHPLTWVILPICWLAPAMFAASLGLWFSTVCSTTTRSVLATIFSGLFLAGGHWILMAFCCFLPFALLSAFAPNHELTKFLSMVEAGLTPPFVFGAVTVMENYEANSYNRDFVTSLLAGVIVGMLIWLIASAVMFESARNRFRAMYNRASAEKRPATRSDLPADRESVDGGVVR